jgi:hypothetical protein
VLVERVEGFCGEADWMRAYDEINAFEEQLAQAGAVVVKFWMAIITRRAIAPLPGTQGHTRTRTSRSPTMTGATARSGRSTNAPSAT